MESAIAKLERCTIIDLHGPGVSTKIKGESEVIDCHTIRWENTAVVSFDNGILMM